MNESELTAAQSTPAESAWGLASALPSCPRRPAIGDYPAPPPGSRLACRCLTCRSPIPTGGGCPRCTSKGVAP